MTDHNVTGGTRRELTKYRITFAAALAALALAGAGGLAGLGLGASKS